MGFLRVFIPGRMDLILAWVLAGIFVPIVLIVVVAGVVADTAFDQPLFLTLIFGPPVLMPFIAWHRRRRWWLWGLFGVISAVVGIGQPLLQPVTVITALLTGEPGKAPRRFLGRAPRAAEPQAAPAPVQETPAAALPPLPEPADVSDTDDLASGDAHPAEEAGPPMVDVRDQPPLPDPSRQRPAPRRPFRSRRRPRS